MRKPAITADQAATRILEHHFGRAPHGLKRLKGGLTNQVFEAQVGREQVIVRISDNPAKLQVFFKEQWAINCARKHKVPTAEVLEVGNEVCGMPYMISQKITGRSGMGSRDKAGLLNSLGRYAALINKIPTHDFGHVFDWSRNKLSRHATWQEYLDEELHLNERLEVFAKTQILERENFRKLSEELKRIRRWNDKPSLSHGDIRLKNVVLDDHRNIVAILDWEDCTSNIAPFWELSIALHDLTMDEKEMFLEGYGLSLRDYMKMAPSIKALNILNYANPTRIAWEEKNKEQLLSLRARLNGTFDLYSL